MIFDMNLNEAAVEKEAARIGKIHASLAKHGLKPHFLDVWLLGFEVTSGSKTNFVRFDRNKSKLPTNLRAVLLCGF